MRKYKITLDTYKKQAFYIEFSSLDTDNFLSVVIAEKGVEKDISNCVLTLELDGQVITGEILDNTATFDLTPALTGEEGVKPVQIGLYENGALTSMYSFQINISEGAGNIDYELNGFENPNLATEILCKISKNQETTNTALQEIYAILSQKLNKTTGKTSEIINDGNGSSPFATTEEVAQAIANLVDSSPDALDTLKELADALGNDPEFATTVLNLIGTKVDKATYEEDKAEIEEEMSQHDHRIGVNENNIVALEGRINENKEDISGLKENFDYLDNERNLMNNEIATLKSEKVDKVNGKGLSEEDYTTEEKQKLSDLPANEELQRVLETKATKEEVAQAIANLVNSSPDALDTLKELADALGNDPDFATTVLNLIGTKVDKATYNDKMLSIDESIEEIENNIGDIDSALSELHNYAQTLISGGAL